MIKRKKNVYKLDTPNTTLLIRAEAGEEAEYLYYGPLLTAPVSDYGFLRGEERGERAPLRLVSSFGGTDGKRAGVVCTFADGSFSARFLFRAAKTQEKPDLFPLPSSYSETEGKNFCRTLCLEFSDEEARLRLFLYYTVFADSDVIAVSSRLYNNGKKEVFVENLVSLQLELPGEYSFGFFRTGKTGEPTLLSAPAGEGILSNETVSGFSSRRADPFAILKKEGSVYAFNLLYSGNFKETAQFDVAGRTRVLVGVNDFLLRKKLAPGESFFSPEATMTFARDEDGISRAAHDFARRHVVRGKWRDRERPVAYFCRVDSYARIDSEAVLAEAKKAADFGAELFVVDAERPDYEKGSALPAIAENVRALGLKFGVNAEPETLFADGENRAKRSEYAMKIPGRAPLCVNGRIAVDLANEKAQKFVVRSLSALIADTKAAYVKWDCNRPITDCFSKEVPSGEYFLRYTEGFYTVFGKLVERFPGVLFESGENGRFDPGSLCFAPQIRLGGTTGAENVREKVFPDVLRASYGFPQSAFAPYLLPLFEDSESSSSDGEGNGGEERAKKGIAFYKKYRKILQGGDFYRLGEGKRVYGAICVSADKTAAVAVLRTERGDKAVRAKLKGLDGQISYDVKFRGENGAFSPVFSASGELLENGGIPVCPYGRAGGDPARGSVCERVLVVEKTKRNKTE